MAIGDNFKGAFAELQGEDLDPDPRSESKQDRYSWFESPGTEHFHPPKDEMQQYWRAYETVPFVRQSISAFAREVVEPGWWIEADNDETAEELAQWLRSACIIEGEKGKDFTFLLRKTAIQREVRGTAIVEHVPDKSDRDAIAALKMLNPETLTAFTKPDTTLLWDPDDNAPKGVPRTDDGDVATWVQFHEDDQWGDHESNPFAQDDITKVARDADVGEIYGTSRLEAVLPRIDSLRTKLSSLDQAIESKAWPTWIFQFGQPEDTWHPDEIDDFMDEQEPDSFTPGTKHGVQGDISVETVGGEVPDLEYSIKYDVSHIMSIMPMPKAATGFAEDINQFVTRFQNERIKRQVKEARRELEHDFNNVLEMKAEELGLNTEGLQLRIAPPNGDDAADIEDRATTIRYVSDADQNQQQEQEGRDGASSNPQNNENQEPGSQPADD